MSVGICREVEKRKGIEKGTFNVENDAHRHQNYDIKNFESEEIHMG